MSLFERYDPQPARRPPAFEGVIRPARAEDAPALARITAERHDSPLDEALQGAGKELADAGFGTRSMVFVAEDGGAIVGFGRTRLVETMEDVEPALRPPAGWYLLGVIVVPAHRRRGIGRALTKARLDWLREHAREAFYFSRRTNRASIALHHELGFREHQALFEYPRTGLAPGDGMLYRVTFDV